MADEELSSIVEDLSQKIKFDMTHYGKLRDDTHGLFELFQIAPDMITRISIRLKLGYLQTVADIVSAFPKVHYVPIFSENFALTFFILKACKYGHLEFLISLKDHPKYLKTITKKLISALFRAIKYQHVEIIKYLFNFGPISSSDINDLSELAARIGNEEIVNLLINVGAFNVELAICALIPNENLKILKILTSNLESINSHLLEFVIESECRETVEYFLDIFKFDMGTLNRGLCTAKSIPMAQLLIDKGATHVDGAMYNMIKNKIDIKYFKFLLRHGACNNSTLLALIYSRCNDVKYFRLLIENGLNPSYCLKAIVIIDWIEESEFITFLQELIHRGASNFDEALMIAILGSEKIVDFLIQKGANNFQAAFLSAMTFENIKDEVLDILIDRITNVTPEMIEVAITSSHKTLIMRLLEKEPRYINDKQ